MHQQDRAHHPRSCPDAEADVTINERDPDLGEVLHSDKMWATARFVEPAAFCLHFVAVPWSVRLRDNRNLVHRPDFLVL